MPVLCLTFLRSGKVYFNREKSGNFKRGNRANLKEHVAIFKLSNVLKEYDVPVIIRKSVIYYVKYNDRRVAVKKKRRHAKKEEEVQKENSIFLMFTIFILKSP